MQNKHFLAPKSNKQKLEAPKFKKKLYHKQYEFIEEQLDLLKDAIELIEHEAVMRVLGSLEGIIDNLKKKHCVKSVQIRIFFWSVFSRIRTEYGEILRISPYSVRMWKNTDQKKIRIWTLFM